MLVIDHMVPGAYERREAVHKLLIVPICIMEVASRHLILVTSHPPTVAQLDSDCVSIIGLALPFQVGPGEGGVGV